MEKPKNPKQYVGKKVRMINKDLHKSNSSWYPKAGTIGTIVDFGFTDNTVCVDWGENSGVDKNLIENNYAWAVGWKFIEPVNDTQPNQPNMTNEEIWEMLESKMRKNGLKKEMGALYYDNKLTNGYWVYTPDDVHNAIAIAYRSGYERAMKGRPFKFGEKKKGGHWEPVDPSNLPKEGTRVRYSRECEHYVSASEMIGLGDIGEFSYSRILNLPGIRFNDDRYWDWVSFSNSLECLDMWVEDDE